MPKTDGDRILMMKIKMRSKMMTTLAGKFAEELTE